MFVVKHNLAFLSSEHASKLFSLMFIDSDIARKFGCARTKYIHSQRSFVSIFSC